MKPFSFFLFLTLLQSSVQARPMTFAIIGDAGAWTARTKKVMHSIMDSNVVNLILPGDNLYHEDETYDSIWSHWLKKGFTFPVVAIGNHTAGYDEEVAYFEMPGQYYSKDIGGARFIVLNSDNEAIAQDQIQFARSELVNSANQFNFIVYHHPTYTISNHHSWVEKKNFQLGMRSLLAEFEDKITALFVGHDHVAGLIEVGNIPMIVSGAAYESRDVTGRHYIEDGVEVHTRWLSGGSPYWTRLDYDDEKNTVWINFINVSKQRVKCSIQIFPRPNALEKNCYREVNRSPALGN